MQRVSVRCAVRPMRLLRHADKTIGIFCPLPTPPPPPPKQKKIFHDRRVSLMN